MDAGWEGGAAALRFGPAGSPRRDAMQWLSFGPEHDSVSDNASEVRANEEEFKG